MKWKQVRDAPNLKLWVRGNETLSIAMYKRGMWQARHKRAGQLIDQSKMVPKKEAEAMVRRHMK